MTIFSLISFLILSQNTISGQTTYIPSGKTRTVKANRRGDTKIICNGPCNIYIGNKLFRLNQNRSRALCLGSKVASYRPQQVISAPENIKRINIKKDDDGKEAGVNTTPLFTTAENLKKGQLYQDYMFLGMYSGFQYGVTDNLELGIKVVVPAIIAGIKDDMLNDKNFRKMIVQLNAKYSLIHTENFHLAVRATLPIFSSEVIATANLGALSITGALGLAVDPSGGGNNLLWSRASAKLKLSKRFALFGEYVKAKTKDDGDLAEFYSVALRNIKGNFIVDYGVGILPIDDFAIPLIYINFGYLVN